MTWFTAICVLACTTFVACLVPIELTDETFSSTIKEGKPVFVKFYAPWYSDAHINNLIITRVIGVVIASD